jgi:hypothetical protein
MEGKHPFNIPGKVLQIRQQESDATTTLASIFSGKSESAIRSGLSYEKD